MAQAENTVLCNILFFYKHTNDFYLCVSAFIRGLLLYLIKGQ